MEENDSSPEKLTCKDFNLVVDNEEECRYLKNGGNNFMKGPPYKPFLQKSKSIYYKIDRVSDCITFRVTGNVSKAKLISGFSAHKYSFGARPFGGAPSKRTFSTVTPDKDGNLWFFGEGELFYLGMTACCEFFVKLYVSAEKNIKDVVLFSNWYFINPEKRQLYYKPFSMILPIGVEINGEIGYVNKCVTYDYGSCSVEKIKHPKTKTKIVWVWKDSSSVYTREEETYVLSKNLSLEEKDMLIRYKDNQNGGLCFFLLRYCGFNLTFKLYKSVWERLNTVPVDYEEENEMFLRNRGNWRPHEDRYKNIKLFETFRILCCEEFRSLLEDINYTEHFFDKY